MRCVLYNGPSDNICLPGNLWIAGDTNSTRRLFRFKKLIDSICCLPHLIEVIEFRSTDTGETAASGAG